jgi:hypothetical protein
MTILVALGLASTALAEDPPATKKGFQEAISVQIELAKKGDLEKFRSRFTERLRSRITRKMMSKAVKADNTPLDELVYAVEPGSHEGKRSAKVKMKNGRTLTTFVLVDGDWLTDTLWFK